MRSPIAMAGLALTPGQTHDGQAAAELLAELSERAVVLADKAYDSDAIRALIEAQGAAPNIPARSTRKARFCFSRRLYKARNRIERLFNKRAGLAHAIVAFSTNHRSAR